MSHTGHRINGLGRAPDDILSILEGHYSCINEAQTLLSGNQGY